MHEPPGVATVTTPVMKITTANSCTVLTLARELIQASPNFILFPVSQDLSLPSYKESQRSRERCF